jgi:hypothetical protein
MLRVFDNDFVIDLVLVRNPFGVLAVIVLYDDLLSSFPDVLPVGFEPYGMDRVASEDKLHGRSPHGCVYSSSHSKGYGAEDSIPTAIGKARSACDVLGSYHTVNGLMASLDHRVHLGVASGD